MKDEIRIFPEIRMAFSGDELRVIADGLSKVDDEWSKCCDIYALRDRINTAHDRVTRLYQVLREDE